MLVVIVGIGASNEIRNCYSGFPAYTELDTSSSQGLSKRVVKNLKKQVDRTYFVTETKNDFVHNWDDVITSESCNLMDPLADVLNNTKRVEQVRRKAQKEIASKKQCAVTAMFSHVVSNVDIRNPYGTLKYIGRHYHAPSD